MKNKISSLLKSLTVLSSFGGVILSLFFARQDGYSAWSKRLLYFTAQSNIWIGVTFFLLLILPLKKKNAERWTARLYLLKYIFTVCITMTGLIFCALLAPFSEGDYQPWRLCNLLTHVFTPAFALSDLFLDDQPISLGGNKVFLPLLPFFAYFLGTSVLGFANVDFGRGVTYPYFFFHYRSPAGIFGFSNTHPFYVGSFYWILLFCGMVIGISFLYRTLIERKKKRRTA